MQKKILQLLVLIFGGLIMLTSCSKHSNSSNMADTLFVDVGSEPPNLDPLIMEDVSSARVTYDLFAGLVDFDQQNNVIPGIAKKWDISADGKTYVFHLRQDGKFSDGTAITARDFVYSWQKLVDPKTASTYNFLLSGVVNGQAIIDGKQPANTLGVKALDDYTFVVNLTSPDTSFLAKNTLPNLMVVPQKVIERYGAKWTDPENMVTSGAYKLKAHVVNGYILAEKNPYFYNESNVSISKVKYFPYVDTNTSLSSYASGDLDTTFQNLPIDQNAKIKSDYKQQLHTVKQEALAFYSFNMKMPELGDNLNLRKALSMAIDREELSKNVLNGDKDPVYSVVTPTVENGKYADIKYDWSTWPKEQRLAEARRLYALAGYSKDHPFNANVIYNTNDMYKKITLAMASMWKVNLGVNVTISNQEWKQLLQSRNKSDFQIARGGWYADYNSVSNYTVLFTCNGALNYSKWCDHKFDSLVDMATAEVNEDKREKLYKLALQIAADGYSMIPLFQFSYTRLVKPRVLNYDIDNNYLDHVQTKWFNLSK